MAVAEPKAASTSQFLILILTLTRSCIEQRETCRTMLITRGDHPWTERSDEFTGDL